MHQHLSTCRGTYATPTADAVLCHSSPELILVIPDHCRSCEYTAFCNQWETRIAEAQAQQTAARHMLAGFRASTAPVARNDDDDDENDDKLLLNHHNDDDDDAAMMQDLGFDDAGAAARARTAAEARVDALWQQFQHEQWVAWRAFLTSDAAQDPASARRRRRNRRPSPRELGASPLHAVTHAHELPEPLTARSYYDDDESAILSDDSGADAAADADDGGWGGSLTREPSAVSALDSADSSPGSSPTSEPCYSPPCGGTGDGLGGDGDEDEDDDEDDDDDTTPLGAWTPGCAGRAWTEDDDVFSRSWASKGGFTAPMPSPIAERGMGACGFGLGISVGAGDDMLPNY